ncbi:MAG: hypothetical protein KatS3mg061_2026 [Dehalococcoidia bacterium]|nr:MAG: hypothetical protein KatS3mg061_2026 [Dehalococcoidia bacterium]
MTTVFDLVLALHNVVRWGVLIAAVLASLAMLQGWLGKRPWTARDRQLGLLFVITMDIQTLLGLILYLRYLTLLPGGLASAMGNPGLRFFAVEHAVAMVLALVLVHLGQVLSRRRQRDQAKFRVGAICFGLATLLLLVGIPWPWLSYGRSLLPTLG